MGQPGKMATVPGWAQTPEVAGGARSMATSWLQAGWLTASGVALTQDALLAGASKRPWEGRGNRLPAHPPWECEGAGHVCPANNCSSHPSAKPGSGHSLPAFLVPPLASFHTVLQLRIHRRNQDCSKWGPPKGRDGGLSTQGPCLPPNSEIPACHFQGTLESAGPPHLLSSPQFSHPRCPNLSSLSHTQSSEYSFFLACPFPWNHGVQASPGSVPGTHY